MFSNEVVDKPISTYSKPDELMSTQPSHSAFAYFEALIYTALLKNNAFFNREISIGTVESTFYMIHNKFRYGH